MGKLLVFRLILLSALLMFGLSTTFTWNATGGGFWNWAQNWNPAGPPGSFDTAIVNSSQTVAVATGSYEVGLLILAGGAILSAKYPGSVFTMNYGCSLYDTASWISNGNIYTNGTVNWMSTGYEFFYFLLLMCIIVTLNI